jgi:hypothetical protein
MHGYHDMSDELFEVAFSGQIRDGADLDQVKARVGKMFNADDAKIATMFSGKRLVIKRNLDREATTRYKAAFKKAGAKCEVALMSGGLPPTGADKPTAQAKPSAPAVATLQVDYTSTQEVQAVVAPPPKVDPLGITGDQIEDLAATIAPVGSELQDEIKEVAEPDIDIAIFEVAPVGSDIGAKKRQEDPPPPDTAGMAVIEP